MGFSSCKPILKCVHGNKDEGELVNLPNESDKEKKNENKNNPIENNNNQKNIHSTDLPDNQYLNKINLSPIKETNKENYYDDVTKDDNVFNSIETNKKMNNKFKSNKNQFRNNNESGNNYNKEISNKFQNEIIESFENINKYNNNNENNNQSNYNNINDNNNNLNNDNNNENNNQSNYNNINDNNNNLNNDNNNEYNNQSNYNNINDNNNNLNNDNNNEYNNQRNNNDYDDYKNENYNDNNNDNNNENYNENSNEDSNDDYLENYNKNFINNDVVYTFSWKNIDVLSIVPESKLQSNDMNIIVNFGYLNKFLLSTSSNVEKYCLLSKSKFCMYKSKETVLRKQKPFLMMSLKDIEKCDIVYMDFLNKKNLEDYFFFYILKKNLQFKIPQMNNIVFNKEIIEEYDMQNNSEVYNLLSLKKNILEQIFSRNDLIILYTENEDDCNKWVCLINYFINYYKQKI